MINSYEELNTVTQDLYCIVFRGTVDGIERLCYFINNNKPLMFYNYKQAKEYFDLHKISTRRDNIPFWRKGELLFPDAKIVKFTVSNFEVAAE